MCVYVSAGNARSGKSFLMNSISGVSGLFKVLKSAEPCTKGVDISNFIATSTQLQQRAQALRNAHITSPSSSSTIAPASSSSPSSSPSLAFLDVEGQGAEDGTHDTLLALPLLLTSKIVLFNHKGAPTVSDMLSKLGVLARAADYIQLDDDSVGGDNEDDDDDTQKKTEQGKKGTLRKLFSSRSASVDAPRKKFGIHYHIHVTVIDTC